MVRDMFNRLMQSCRLPIRKKAPRETGLDDSQASRLRKKIQNAPLAVEILDRHDSINPQLQSFFAKFPREVRELIWDFALTFYEDLDHIYDVGETYARPGRAAPLRVAVGLLLTCKAVYVETYLKPFQVNPITCFDTSNSELPPLGDPLTRTARALGTWGKLKYWQFAAISSVEIMVAQFNLEGVGAVERVSRLIGTSGRHRGLYSRGWNIAGFATFVEPTKPDHDVSGSSETPNTYTSPSKHNHLIGRKITHLTLRMSRTDWWTYEIRPGECVEPKDKLRLEPMINMTFSPRIQTDGLSMTHGYETRKEGREPDFGLDGFEKPGCWGAQISEYWPDLETLNLVLETFACKKDQLDYVIKCAKLWKFAQKNGYHLEWNGKDAEVARWRGASSYEYEMGETWFTQSNTARIFKTPESKITKWRPAGIDHDVDPDHVQEFVIQTLTFERRKD